MFAKLIFSSFFLRILNVILMASGTFFLARILSEKDFGTYTLILSYVTICIIPLHAGLPILSIRVVSKKEKLLIPKSLIKFSYHAVVKYFLILMLADLTLSLLNINPIENYRTYFYLLALSTLFLAILNGYMQGINLIIKSQLLEQVLRPSIFIGLIVLAYYIYSNSNIEYNFTVPIIILIMSFCIVAILIIFFLLIKNKFDLDNDSKSDRKQWKKELLPLSSLTGLQVMLSQLDIVFLGNMVSHEAIATYKIATQFAITITLISTVVGSLLAPQINRLYFNDVHSLKNIIYKSNWISLIAGMLIMIFFLFFSEAIIVYILGDSYKDASQYLLILCFGYLISSLFGPISTVVNMLSLEKLNLVSVLIAVISNIALLYSLIPIFGNYGAATSTAISMILWKASLTLLTSKKINTSCYIQLRN